MTNTTPFEQDVDVVEAPNYTEQAERMVSVEEAVHETFDPYDGVDVGTDARPFGQPSKQSYVSVEADSVRVEVYPNKVRCERTGPDTLTAEDEEVMEFAYGLVESDDPFFVEESVDPGEAAYESVKVDGESLAVDTDVEGFDTFREEVDRTYEESNTRPGWDRRPV